MHCAGWVAADGDVEQSTPSGCFNVIHAETGKYEIHFATAMTAPPVCVVSPYYESSDANTVTNAGATHIGKKEFYYSTGGYYGNLEDSSATFICFLIEG